MKILLLGDTSNFHNTLAKGLRSYGHDVTVASDGTQWMDTGRDIDLSRKPGKQGGLELWLKMRWTDRKALSGYDIVSISGTHFAVLHPQLLKSIFKYVKEHNGRVFQTALATDTYYIEEALDPASRLRYNEWRVGNDATDYSREFRDKALAWLSAPLRTYCDYLSQHVDGSVAALYEYYISQQRAMPVDKIGYGGIPIDTDAIEFKPLDLAPDQPVRLFLGYPSKRMKEKGADRLLAAAQAVVAKYPGLCRLDVVSDVPLSQFLDRMSRAHIVIDQLYSYTPATTALMAMSMGKTVLSGAENDYYDFIDEKTLRPIINLEPDDQAIFHAIEHVVLNRDELPGRGLESRQFVEKHNDMRVVAGRFLQLWSELTNFKNEK